MQKQYDIIIAGGGLSGLTAAILFSRKSKVLFIDPDDYPRHKMCGEYLSNEVIDFLKTLGIDLDQESAVNLEHLNFTTSNHQPLTCHLPQGGKGISRFHLDHLLYQKAIEKATFSQDKVLEARIENDSFQVSTSTEEYTCKQFLMATGKRSLLDKRLERDFIQQKSPWLAVKMHYKHDMDDNLVELHNFEGGYAGVSKVENGHVNLCYLASYDSFKKHKNVTDFNNQVLAKNKSLNVFLKNAQPVWEQPITISQISFEKKEPVENQIVMLGDTAGLIHPLCGNGMAMAIHSAKIAYEELQPFLEGQINRAQALDNYAVTWKKTFQKRLKIGRILQGILLNRTYTKLGLWFLRRFPSLLSTIIKSTHGKPI
ncbi:flavin-dependent dehydrogenase [Nonlabens dokdonensis]|uniref:FAD dependent oxidoreductase n=2 Tax=Nonlabens dokdonensis TaxID=328515 RepID=L7WDX4_NONDD|nr:NAD(P)/FAD-dependent oxidoreductase [Nonlabens dokdonensis]AGC78284.1 FAD dependent oxidoreductase [Nonlabens dokdonensis DSW-6]PZX37828.1 flavin-dependent dehydrogenase [Nonlabens dokdonensis]